MRSSEFVQDAIERTEALIQRVKIATAGVEKDRFNRRPPSGEWSPGEVFEHMMLADKKYIQTLQDALDGPVGAVDQRPVQFSFVGKLIIKAAGPGGNAPAPGFLKPVGGPFELSLVDAWVQQHEQIIELLRKAEGVDFSRTKVRNPFFSFLPMNLADIVEILTCHAERHVAQIEERIR